MSSLNKVQLIGNLGQPPELKYTQSGTPYCMLSLATSDSWTDKSGQRHERTEWHRVSVWKKQAENIGKYCTKGSTVYVEGRLQTRSWDESGQKQYQTDVIAETVKFLSRPKEESPPEVASRKTKISPNIHGNFAQSELGDDPF